MEKFTVLFKDGAPRDWRKAADVAAAACVEIPEGEFVRGCRKDCGLIRLDLIEAQATEIAAALSGAGFEARAILKTSIVQAPKPQPVFSAGVAPEGFAIVEYAGGDPDNAALRPQLVAWAQICAVNVACVQQSRKESVISAMSAGGRADNNDTVSGQLLNVGLISASSGSGGGIGFGSIRDLRKSALSDISSSKSAEPDDYLELYLLSPLLRLRIRRNWFRYDYLKERQAPASRTNFKLLLGDILNAAPHLHRAGHVDLALAGRVLNDTSRVVEGPDFEHSVTALLTRESLGYV